MLRTNLKGEGSVLYIEEYLGRVVLSFRSTKIHIEAPAGACHVAVSLEISSVTQSSL